MAKVSIVTEGPTAGIWVTTKDGHTVGLVAEDRLGAYLMIQPNPSDSSSVPFAIATHAGDKDVEVQIPGPDGKLNGVRIFPIAKLIDLLG